MNLSQCHFSHHKSYTDWPGIEPDLGGNEHGMEPYKDTMWRARYIELVQDLVQRGNFILTVLNHLATKPLG